MASLHPAHTAVSRKLIKPSSHLPKLAVLCVSCWAPPRTVHSLYQDSVFRFSLLNPSEPQLGLTLKNTGQHSGWYPSFWQEQENRAWCYGAVIPPGVAVTRLSTVWAGRTLCSGLAFGTDPGPDTQSRWTLHAANPTPDVTHQEWV